MPVLIVEKGPDKGFSVAYAEQGLVIGRSTKASVKLNDNGISREHFHIFDQDGKFYIEDMGSLNGTRVNNICIGGSVILKDGDQIEIGETSLSWSEKDATAQKDPFINQKVGGYYILERLGRGGMGTVYRAQQLSLQRDVAIKILHPALGQDNLFIQRFIEEARSCATLNHPHILQVYDVGEDAGRYYFSMEYAAGGSVQRLIEGQKALPVQEALGYMIGTAQGLEYAERKKIVHRDIKPDNLMLTEDKVIKIGDLGLAKRIDERQNQDKDKGEQIFGTPHFIAPEQAKGEPVDHRTDIYSFGASFYRILSGKTPFQGKNIQELVRKHVTDEPAPLKSLIDSLPDELCRIIGKMMQKEPAKRYQSNTEILEALYELQKKQAWETKRASKASSTNRTNSTNKLMSKTGAHKRPKNLNRLAPAQPKFNWIVWAPILAISGISMLFIVLLLGKPAPHPIIRTTPQPVTVVPKTVPVVSTNDPKQNKTFEDEATTLYEEAKKLSATSMKDALQKYEKIKTDFPNTEVTKWAEQDILKLQQLICTKARNAFKDIEALQQQKQWDDAWGKFLRLKEETKTFLWLNSEIVTFQNKLEDTVVGTATAVETKIRNMLKEEEWDNAAREIQNLKQLPLRFTPTLEKSLERKAQELEKCLVAAREKTARDEQIVDSHQQILRPHLKSYQFSKGAEELRVLLNGLNTRKQKERLEQIIEDLAILDNLWFKINTGLKDDKYSLDTEALCTQFPKFANFTSKGEVKLREIKDGKLLFYIYLRNVSGHIEQNHSISGVQPLWLYENVLFPLTVRLDDTWLDIAVYCYYYKLYEQGWECCQKAGPKYQNARLQDFKQRFDMVEQQARNQYETKIVVEFQTLQKALEATTGDSSRREVLKAHVAELQKTLQRYREEFQYTRFFKKIVGK